MIGGFVNAATARAAGTIAYKAGVGFFNSTSGYFQYEVEVVDEINTGLPTYLIVVDNSEEEEKEPEPGIITQTKNMFDIESTFAFIGGVTGCTIFYLVIPPQISIGGSLLATFVSAVVNEISQRVAKQAGKCVSFNSVQSTSEQGVYQVSLSINDSPEKNSNDQTTLDEQKNLPKKPTADSVGIPVLEDEQQYFTVESRVKIVQDNLQDTIKEDYQQKLEPAGKESYQKAEKPVIPLIVPTTRKAINHKDVPNSLETKLKGHGTLHMTLCNTKGEPQYFFYQGSIKELGLVSEPAETSEELLIAQIDSLLNLSLQNNEGAKEKRVRGGQNKIPYQNVILNLFKLNKEQTLPLLRAPEPSSTEETNSALCANQDKHSPVRP